MKTRLLGSGGMGMLRKSDGEKTQRSGGPGGAPVRPGGIGEMAAGASAPARQRRPDGNRKQSGQPDAAKDIFAGPVTFSGFRPLAGRRLFRIGFGFRPAPPGSEIRVYTEKMLGRHRRLIYRAGWKKQGAGKDSSDFFRFAVPVRPEILPVFANEMSQRVLPVRQRRQVKGG